MAILQLLDYRFTKLLIEYVSKGHSDSKEHNLQLTPTIKQSGNPDDHNYELLFKLLIEPGQGGGLLINAEFGGLFQPPPNLSKDDALELVQTNGLALLYSTLRGELAHITSSFPVEKVILPTIPIRPFAELKKQNKKTPKKKVTSKKKTSVKKKTTRKKHPINNILHCPVGESQAPLPE